MIPVLPLAYLPPVEYIAWLLQQKTVYFNSSDHFQKQTYRNRCVILGANGILKLSIPIVHQSGKAHQKGTEVSIFNEVSWQKQHWKSISIAYRSAPFFEFYEDDLKPHYETLNPNLWDWNFELLEKIMHMLNLPLSFKVVNFNPQQHNRMEHLLNAKVIPQKDFPSYTQVFSDRLGFHSNLSIIDLLFNLGPQSESYLRAIPTVI